MSHSFHRKESIAHTTGLCLSILGTMLLIIGFFLPLVFWQGIGSHTIDGQESQWEMVQVYSSLLANTWLLWAVLVFPFLAAVSGLIISIITAILQQYNYRLVRWKRYVAGAGAILELLVGPFVFFLSGMLGAKIFIGPGLVLLLTGSVALLVGLYLESRH